MYSRNGEVRSAMHDCCPSLRMQRLGNINRTTVPENVRLSVNPDGSEKVMNRQLLMN